MLYLKEESDYLVSISAEYDHFNSVALGKKQVTSKKILNELSSRLIEVGVRHSIQYQDRDVQHSGSTLPTVKLFEGFDFIDGDIESLHQILGRVS